MIKQIMNGFSKFFTKERVIILVAFLILTWALYSYTGSKNTIIDTMDSGSYGMDTGSYGMDSGSYDMDYGSDSMTNYSSTPSAPPSMPSAPPSMSSTPPSMSSAPQDTSIYSNVANPSDLLPKDDNSQWATLNPLHSGSSIMTPDLLTAGYHIGLDTIGQTLRNPNLQLRSDPIIEKMNVGPWNMSTIEADFGRVPLELGSCSK